ncbi:MAG: hypothetical protein ABI181_11985 [Mycobacteriaceae bacterium]
MKGPTTVLTFDRVQFLTGEAATKANGGKKPGGDNGYKIVDDSPMLRTVGVAPNVTVTGSLGMSTFLDPADQSPSPRPYTLEQLVRFLGAKQPGHELFRLTYNGSGLIKTVTEVYLP